MKNLCAIVSLAFLGVACSGSETLIIPPFPDPPTDWAKFSSSTIPGSDCPFIEGEYLEPPQVRRLGGDARYFPEDDQWLFLGYIPFHLADRTELKVNEQSLHKNNFVIRQPDASHFYFSFLNEQATVTSEYNFRSDDGDFKCGKGVIKFTEINRYGMIEGVSVNFQVRNVLFVDEERALIIQSARGPYRGSSSKGSKDFTYEFFRYPKDDKQHNDN